MAYDTVLIGVVLALLVAVLYSLRRIYLLEYKLVALDLKIERILEHLVKKRK